MTLSFKVRLNYLYCSQGPYMYLAYKTTFTTLYHVTYNPSDPSLQTAVDTATHWSKKNNMRKNASRCVSVNSSLGHFIVSSSFQEIIIYISFNKKKHHKPLD